MRGGPRGHGRDQRSISLPHTLFGSPTNTIRVRPKEELMEKWKRWIGSNARPEPRKTVYQDVLSLPTVDGIMSIMASMLHSLGR